MLGALDGICIKLKNLIIRVSLHPFTVAMATMRSVSRLSVTGTLYFVVFPAFLWGYTCCTRECNILVYGRCAWYFHLDCKWRSLSRVWDYNGSVSGLNFSERPGYLQCFLSSLDIRIEQVIGMIISFWRLLRDPLNFSVIDFANINFMSVSLKLHKFWIEQVSIPGSVCSWDRNNANLGHKEKACSITSRGRSTAQQWTSTATQ